MGPPNGVSVLLPSSNNLFAIYPLYPIRSFNLLPILHVPLPLQPFLSSTPGKGGGQQKKKEARSAKTRRDRRKKNRQDRNISLLTKTTGHSTGIYWALGWVVGTGLGYQTAVCGLVTILSSSFLTFGE